MDNRSLLLKRIDGLPDAGLAALLAMLAKVCPKCGAVGIVRTTKGDTMYLRCPCGRRFKRTKVVRVQP